MPVQGQKRQLPVVWFCDLVVVETHNNKPAKLRGIMLDIVAD